MSDTASGRTALHPDEALRLVEDFTLRPAIESVPLAAALGRALAGPLTALVDQPPFDKSAMDGFAYGASPGPWRVSALVAAGAGMPRALGPGEAARIMTGAPLPAGAHAVQRLEWTAESEDPEGILVTFTRPERSDNVIRRGENQRAGEELLSPRILVAQDIGILASSGYAELPVARRPLVGIIATGDELAPAGRPLAPGEIYDSNGPQLEAQVAAAGCLARRYDMVRDEAGALGEAVARALADCEVLLVSGGVSMGDLDYVPRVLEAAGVRKLFHGLAMRPGKPTFFGIAGEKAVFGLPGNPVSTFVNFEVLVKAHLFRRMGLSYEPAIVEARLAAPLVRKETDRVEFLPARLERAPRGTLRGAAGGDGLLVRPLVYHGSSMLAALAGADCLLRMELGVERIDEGSMVDARLVRP